MSSRLCESPQPLNAPLPMLESLAGTEAVCSPMVSISKQRAWLGPCQEYMTCNGHPRVLPRNPTDGISTLFLDSTPTHYNVLLTPTPKTASQAQSGKPLGPACRYPASGETPNIKSGRLCVMLCMSVRHQHSRIVAQRQVTCDGRLAEVERRAHYCTSLCPQRPASVIPTHYSSLPVTPSMLYHQWQ